jgi:hypothetical protein
MNGISFARHRILEGAGFKEVSLTPHEPAMPLAGPGGAAEAASFTFRVGPVARATKDPVLPKIVPC